MRKILMIILLLLSYGYSQAQEVSELYVTSDSLQIYFRQDKILLEERFRNNGRRLEEFSHHFNKLLSNPDNNVRSILIVSGASPEGSSTRNRYLSDNRAKVVYDYLLDNHLVDPAHIEVESRGVDWKGLGKRVEASSLPYKDEVLEILSLPEWISCNGKVVDGRKARLMNFQGGKVWHELYKLYFPDLRGTRVMIAYNILKKETPPEPEIITRTDTVFLEKRDTVYVDRVDTVMKAMYPPQMVPVTADSAPARPRRPFYLAIKSNLLYDALVIPDIGAEIGIRKGLALSGSYHNIWLRNKAWTQWYRLEGFEAGLKWYINREKRPFKGHRIELYGQMLTWDFTYKGRGYLAERWAYGGGLGYGYTMPVGRRFSLDLELGIGYLSGNMHEYIPMDGHRVWQSLERFHWIGPAKAGITLQWLIGRGNLHGRKEVKGR